MHGGVAAFYVGAQTEVEMKEKKDRVDDAVQATRAALEEGVVAGGGVSYLNASKRAERKSKSSKDKFEKVVNKIIYLSLQEPIFRILENSGCDTQAIMLNVYKSPRINYGYDAKNMRYGDLVSMGIVDPYKVVTNTLRNATSVAVEILTTQCIVTNKRADGRS